MSKPILDISKYNNITNWQLVKKNVAGVIIRCGYRGYGLAGTLVEDTKYRNHLQGCIDNDIPIGVYFFPTSINEQEAKAEADFIIELVGNIKLSLPIFLDSEQAAPKGETGRNDNLTPKDRTELLNVTLRYLFDAGYNAGIYASTNWFNTKLVDTSIDARAFKWCAQYVSKCTYDGHYNLWQYRSDGSIPGVDGRCDLSKIIDLPVTTQEKYINLIITNDAGITLLNEKVKI